MEVIYLNDDVKIDTPIVSAIGFFDGLHLGHQKLLDKVCSISQEKGYKKAIMTFNHHPLYVLGKEKEEYYLTSMEDRIALLKDDFDYLLVIDFTKEVASLSYDVFIEKYLIALNIKHVVCGFDFRFGYMNKGDCYILKDYNPALLDVSIVDEVVYEREKVSSTRIRKEIDEGNMEKVKILMGRYYTMTGKVIEGRKLGHSLGFPTANLDYKNYYLPKRGVYAVIVIYDSKKYLGMCNIGYNPTMGSLLKKSVEVNIFDFDKEIYNEEISLVFLDKTRGESQFNSPDELKVQLTHDKNYIKENYKILI